MKMRYTLYQLLAPLRLFVITVGTGRHHAILQLDQPWDKVSDLFFDILAFLERTGQQGRGTIR